MENNPAIIDNTRWLPPPHFLSWKELLPRGDSLSPAPSKRPRWYKITFGSLLCPLLATARVNPVLTGTRTSWILCVFAEKDSNYPDPTTLSREECSISLMFSHSVNSVNSSIK